MSITDLLPNWPLEAFAAFVAGVVILLAPRILNYVVAAYLLLLGALGLLEFLSGHAIRPQAVLALAAGVLVLIKPNILNYVVGVFLVLIGLLEAGILKLW